MGNRNKKSEKASSIDYQIIEYPFGKEYEVSAFQLFTSFCNNLHLGQWELARSSIFQLRNQRKLLDRNIDQTIRTISENPTGYR